jgi:hypothetical protein
MIETWGPDFYRHTQIYGASSGTLIALGITTGKTPEFLDLLYQSLAAKTQYIGSSLFFSFYYELGFRGILTKQDDYKLASDRCFFSTNGFFANHQWHTAWKDNEDLISCANASGHIPLLSHWNHGFNNRLVVDGAFAISGHDLPHRDVTLYIGTSPRADISVSISVREFISPAIEQSYVDAIQAGYDAFMDWDGKFKRKVGIRKPKYLILALLWFLKLVELIFFIPRICFDAVNTGREKCISLGSRKPALHKVIPSYDEGDDFATSRKDIFIRGFSELSV